MVQKAEGSSPFTRPKKFPVFKTGIFLGQGLEPAPKAEGENCRWQFARKSSDENLFSVVKFRGRGT